MPAGRVPRVSTSGSRSRHRIRSAVYVIDLVIVVDVRRAIRLRWSGVVHASVVSFSRRRRTNGRRTTTTATAANRRRTLLADVTRMDETGSARRHWSPGGHSAAGSAPRVSSAVDLAGAWARNAEQTEFAMRRDTTAARRRRGFVGCETSRDRETFPTFGFVLRYRKNAVSEEQDGLDDGSFSGKDVELESSIHQPLVECVNLPRIKMHLCILQIVSYIYTNVIYSRSGLSDVGLATSAGPWRDWKTRSSATLRRCRWSIDWHWSQSAVVDVHKCGRRSSRRNTRSPRIPESFRTTIVLRHTDRLTSGQATGK